MNTAFFDIFGFFIFIVIFVIGYRLRKREKRNSKILLGIGIIGIIADGYSIINGILYGF